MQSGAHLQRASESHHGLLVFATQRVIVADHAARLGAIAIDANAPVRERRELALRLLYVQDVRVPAEGRGDRDLARSTRGGDSAGLKRRVARIDVV